MDDRTTRPPADLSVEEYATGLKNHYYLNKRMTLAAFETEQEFHVRRRRMINRAIHGWGVVQGFAVGKEADASGRLTVGAGFALDESGRELVLVDRRTMAVSDIWTKQEIEERKGQLDQCWVLSVVYDERHEQPITVSDSCHCDRREWEYTRETVRFTLTAEAVESTQEDYTACDAACNRSAAAEDRGPRDRLCEILALRPHSPSDARVALAYVQLAVTGGANSCQTLVFKEIEEDTCSLRRLVIGNEMLYDLVRGRDLTRIEQVSWADWYPTEGDAAAREKHVVSWKQFRSRFPDDPQGPASETGFVVTFSGPVQEASLTSHCFAIHVTTKEAIGGWGETLRVPLRKPIYDHQKHTATLTVASRWVEGEIVDEDSRFNVSSALIEIEVRGDLILDCCGQPVDANAIGFRPPPTGNGSPGGTFLSSFRVEKRRFDKEET